MKSIELKPVYTCPKCGEWVEFESSFATCPKCRTKLFIDDSPYPKIVKVGKK